MYGPGKPLIQEMDSPKPLSQEELKARYDSSTVSVLKVTVAKLGHSNITVVIFKVVLPLNVYISAITVSHLKFLKFIDFCFNIGSVTW